MIIMLQPMEIDKMSISAIDSPSKDLKCVGCDEDDVFVS
jgi:hypothetical protein